MYNHREIEQKWQKYWLDNKTFKTNTINKNKFYVLDMFPYPSGSGLHVGHPEGYTATDIIARFKRLKGYDVLHPIGWDAFGLPAEQFALQTGNLPQEFTKKNINNFRRQLQQLGFSYDYEKEVDTTDPNYYKITQEIFSLLYKNGLAEIRDINVNWCQELGTVLANEEILTLEDGSSVSERGNFPVIKKPMKQWVLKITKYADKLIGGLKDVNWPHSLISLQKNWIMNPDGSLHLKDWTFSRQRYWGEPFPIAFDENNNIYLIENLPVILPEMTEIKPSGTGESPLANNKDWLYFEKDGKKYRRETNTMPQWAGSSWYYLAYILKNSDGTYCDLQSEEAKNRFKKWLPVDLYIGGQEHAVLHLLYARFWHKVLFDLGIVTTNEPFHKIVNQGMILGTDGQKMSKSRGNIINPDDIVYELGADTLRIYEMFMGPLEATKEWNTNSIKGIKKWLDKLFQTFEYFIDQNNTNYKINPNLKTCPLASQINELIVSVEDNIEKLKFNIAVSQMMVFINDLNKYKEIKSVDTLIKFAILLSMFAPHISEEILNKLGAKHIHEQTYPIANLNEITDKDITIAIQINGKLRATLLLNDANISDNEIIKLAKKQPNVESHLVNKNIIKEIYIPKKIVNFVVG